MRRGKRGRYNQGHSNRDPNKQQTDYFNQEYSNKSNYQQSNQPSYNNQEYYPDNNTNYSKTSHQDNYYQHTDNRGNAFSRQSGNAFSKNSYDNNNYKKREYYRKQQNTENQQVEGNQEQQYEENQPQFSNNKPGKGYKYPPNRLYGNYKFDFNENFEKMLKPEQNQQQIPNKFQPSSNTSIKPSENKLTNSGMIIEEETKNIDNEKRIEDIEDDYDREEYQNIMDKVEVNENQFMDSITNKKGVLLENRGGNIIYKIVEKNLKLMSNIEILANILEILQSSKNDAEIQEDLVDLMGYDDIETISEFITNRSEVNELAQAAKIVLEDNDKVKKNNETQFGVNNKPSSSVNLEVLSSKKPKQKKVNKMDINKTQTTNLQILQQLGFDKIMLKENQLLGLHEKPLASSVKRWGGTSSASVGTNPSHFLTTQRKDKTKVETIVKPVLLDKKPVSRVQVSSLPEWAQVNPY